MNCPQVALLTAVAVAAGLLPSGCATKLSPEPFDANLRLTAGQAKMTVKTGVSTQNDVFQALGMPNVVTLRSGGGEVWTYDQIRVRRTSQGYGVGAFFATLFPFSQGTLADGGGAAGVGVDGTVGTTTTAVSTATLVIRFDEQEKVSSFNLLVTSF